MQTSLRFVILAAMALTVAGCHTPVVKMKNESGQVVACGGRDAKTVAGPGTGYQEMRHELTECVEQHEAAGYKRKNPVREFFTTMGK